MKWPNLFLYRQNAGGNVTYSKIPQHTWKAGELIREEYWYNLIGVPPIFKKITIISETSTSTTFNISYKYAEKILLNGGILFVVVSGTKESITYNNILYITLSDFKNNYYSGYSYSGAWQSSIEGGYLQFAHNDSTIK